MACIESAAATTDDTVMRSSVRDILEVAFFTEALLE
jgi:hypothetical protein